MREEFDAYNDDLDLESYDFGEYEDDQDYDSCYTVPTTEQLDGSYGYDEDQWN